MQREGRDRQSRDIRQFANSVDDIFPNCKAPIQISQNEINEALHKQIKGKKRVVTKGQIQGRYQIQTNHQSNKLQECQILFGNIKMETSKLNDVINTRVGNMQGYIRQIINNLAQIK